MNDVAFPPNTLIADRYRILQKIGEGGMAVVYRVEQIFLHEILAVKVLTNGLSDANSVRFQKEAQVCRLLEHPNLIKVIDFAVLPDGAPYLVMEFINGETLSQKLKADGPVAESEAIDIFIQVMEGLEYAHAQGIVHRDLKPSNIMLKRNSQTKKLQVKILDFGIAKMTNKDALNALDLTRTGEIFGSPLYMSPEQCLGRAVDARSDLYSAGCALYHALTGAPPFTGDSALATFMMHQEDKPAPLKEASLGGNFSSGIEEIVTRLLAKSPSARYQSAQEVLEELQSLKSRRRTTSSSASITPLTSKKFSVAVSPAVLVLSIVCVLLASALLLVLYGPPELSGILRVSTPKAIAATQPIKAVETPVTQKAATATATADAALEPTAAATSPFFAPVSMKDAKGSRWQLNFPDKEIGRVGPADDRGIVENSVRASVAAVNKVFLPAPHPLYFATRMEENFTPKDFSKFRDGEIKHLRLVEWRVTDEAIEAIKHKRGIETLELFRCTSLSNESLKSIAQMPDLRNFCVKESNTDIYNLGGSLSSIEIEPLGQMVANSRIKSFTLRNVLQTDRLTHALIDARNLESLSFERASDLSAEGMANVSKIKSLRYLKIKEAPVLSSDAVKLLLDMKNLHHLSLQKCTMTPVLEEVLKRLSERCVIELNTEKF